MVAYLEPQQVERGHHHALLLLRGRPVGAAVHALADLSQEQIQLLEGHGANIHHEGHAQADGPLGTRGPGKALEKQQPGVRSRGHGAGRKQKW